jgi:hypothetical protein
MELRENGQVAYYVLADPWETRDLTSLYPQDNGYRSTVNHVVHTFMDISGVRRIPPNIISARIAAPAFTHPNSGLLIMIGARTLPKVVTETICRVARYDRLHFFATDEEGWTYLRQLGANEVASV